MIVVRYEERVLTLKRGRTNEGDRFRRVSETFRDDSAGKKYAEELRAENDPNIRNVRWCEVRPTTQQE